MSIAIYDQEYYKKFAERANTDLGRKIYATRWAMIEKYCHGNLTLLDYGCGPGAFHLSSRNGFKTTGYDINPYCGFPNLPKEKVDILTMWDSLEHVISPVEVIKGIDPKWLFIATPNLKSVRCENVENWKHFREGEHLYHFVPENLKIILDAIGYETLEVNYDEGLLRDPQNPEAIFSLAAKKRVL
jgi:hypothetical protein